MTEFHAVGKVMVLTRTALPPTLVVRDTDQQIQTAEWTGDPEKLKWKQLDGAALPVWTELAAISVRSNAPADLFAWFRDGKKLYLRWKEERYLPSPFPKAWQTIWG